MRCPVCGVEMRVVGRGEKTRDKKRYTVLKFACRSSQCGCCGKVMAEKEVKKPEDNLQ